MQYLEFRWDKIDNTLYKIYLFLSIEMCEFAG